MARKWVSVKDRLPEPYIEVEVKGTDSMWTDDVRQHWNYMRPTHWRYKTKADALKAKAKRGKKK